MKNPVPSRRFRAMLVAAFTVFSATAASAADPGSSAPRAHGKDEAPGAPIACMNAVKTALPNPDTFKWIKAQYRKVAEDAYSVVADVEYVGADGATRKAMVQCDVLRARGDEFVVPKVRLPH